jgi:hypothetical protein
MLDVLTIVRSAMGVADFDVEAMSCMAVSWSNAANNYVENDKMHDVFTPD